MIRIILSGCNGKMGQTITKLIEEDENMVIVAGVSIDGQVLNYYPVYKAINECTEDADVLLDFSNESLIYDILKFGETKNMPLVIATTGFSEEQIKLIENTAKKIPVFRSANMSLGINLLIELVQKAAKALGEDFDIEITDVHHNKKVDAPSGTSFMIADAINETLETKADYAFERHSKKEQRRKNEIGIHSLRGGTVVGEHTVMFLGHDEVLEITHKSHSRELFARGALRAVKFIIAKESGRLYSMKDIVE